MIRYQHTRQNTVLTARPCTSWGKNRHRPLSNETGHFLVLPKAKHTVLALITFLGSQVVSAGIANHLEVEYVRVDRGGKGLVRFTTPLTNIASCVNGHTMHLSFNANTEGGKAVQALLLTALASGRTVYAQGTNSCLDYANTVESWNWGYVE